MSIAHECTASFRLTFHQQNQSMIQTAYHMLFMFGAAKRYSLIQQNTHKHSIHQLLFEYKFDQHKRKIRICGLRNYPKPVMCVKYRYANIPHTLWCRRRHQSSLFAAGHFSLTRFCRPQTCRPCGRNTCADFMLV